MLCTSKIKGPEKNHFFQICLSLYSKIEKAQITSFFKITSLSLKKFSVKNFDGIIDATCTNIQSLTIIAGPNGVGKSTLLEVLTKVIRGENLANCQIEKSGITRPVYFGPHRAPSPSKIHKSVPVTTQIGPVTEVMSSPSYGVNAPNSSLAPWLSQNYARNRNTPDFAAYFEVKNRLIRLKSKYNDMIIKVHELKKEVPKNYIPDIYGPLNKFIELFLPGISFKDIRITNDNYEVIFTNRMNQEVEFDLLSSGEKDILAMFMPLIELDTQIIIDDVTGNATTIEDLIFLIDGPEQHLHSSILSNFLINLRNLTELAKKKKYTLQFILCTHSEILINSALREELYLMMFPTDEGKNQVISRNELNDEDLEALFGNLGLIAITSGKKILLVEGPTDIDILRILFPHLLRNFSLYPMGGKGGVSSFVNSFQRLFSELESAGVKIYSIMDKDRAKIIDNCKEQVRNRLFVLKKSCLENYLLDNDAMYDALKVLAGSKLNDLNIKSADGLIKLLENTLKDNNYFNEELKARLHEYTSFYVNIGNSISETSEIGEYIDSIAASKKKGLNEDIKKQNELLRDILDTKRYDDLNGKLILGHISSIFGLKRDTLAKVIADKMVQLNHIPPDLTELINKLN